MSTLNVSNITDGTTTVGTSYVVNGSAKAWVNFNGTGTIAARDSLNVSSLTDYAQGSYGPNFSSSMANANYALPAQCSYDLTGATPTNYTQLSVKQGSSYSTTTSCRVNTAYASTGGGNIYDMEIVCLSIFGDLA